MVTVFAYFNDAQRQANKEAEKLLDGKWNLPLMNPQPLQLYVAYGLDKQNREEDILVFDLGGGIFGLKCHIIRDGFCSNIDYT